jgi:hypothetical protein
VSGERLAGRLVLAGAALLAGWVGWQLTPYVFP